MNFTRNLGFISSEEQTLLGEAVVAIAGVGGDGGLVAENLARLGITTFRLADPEVFEPENLNRQNASTVHTIGRNKAEVIAEMILSINPNASVTVFEQGVTVGNVDGFVNGCDVVVDETEFTLHHLAVLLARCARSASIPVVTGFNVGFGCIVTSFQPGGLTLEEYLGLDPHASIEEIAESQVELGRWIPRLPSYVDANVFVAVSEGRISAPSVAPGVSLAAGMVAAEVFNQLIGRTDPVIAPSSIWVDALERRLEIIDDPVASFNDSLEIVLTRTAEGQNVSMGPI
jgi:tRNA threonylcarbamoyladenosine dehydratase